MPLNPDSDPSLKPTLLKSISRAAAESFDASDIRNASFGWKDLPRDGNAPAEDPRKSPTLLLSGMLGEKAADNVTNELATTKHNRATIWKELWKDVFF
jgi:hypothetical protein